MPTPTSTIFGTFTTTRVVGRNVQIHKDLLENVVSGALQLKNTYKGTMRVFNMAQYYGYRFDFHLSFKLDETGQWASAGHFCARDDDVAKNACAYWFYNLVQVVGTGALAWSFEGSAPDNALYVDFMSAISIAPGATSPSARRMLLRRASGPLDKMLVKINALIGQGKAQVVTNRHGTHLLAT